MKDEKLKKNLFVGLILSVFVIAGVNIFNAVSGKELSTFEIVFLAMETYIFVFSTYYLVLTFFGCTKKDILMQNLKQNLL